jgi:hypothetical protein
MRRGSWSKYSSKLGVHNIVTIQRGLVRYLMLNELLSSSHDPRARRRLKAILLSRSNTMTAAQIALRLGIARSTVFAYRRLFAMEGCRGLLARIAPGRPATPFGPALESVLIKGLRMLSWFNVPALRNWIRHHDRVYPEWTVRRWALALIKRLQIRFPKDWRIERMNSYEAFRRSADPDDNPFSRWRRQRAMHDSKQSTLNLVVEDSPGLRPWFPLST